MTAERGCMGMGEEVSEEERRMEQINAIFETIKHAVEAFTSIAEYAPVSFVLHPDDYKLLLVLNELEAWRVPQRVIDFIFDYFPQRALLRFGDVLLHDCISLEDYDE